MKLFKSYKWGIDFLGVLLTALLLLPNIVYWCIPAFGGLDGQKTLAVFAYIFAVIGIAALIALEHKERPPFAYFTLPGTLTWLFLLLSYVAWIFFYCGFQNVAVALFLAACPGVSFVSFAFARKNYPAAVPAALYTFLHFLAVLVLWI